MRGRKPKHKRNISGLQNQPPTLHLPSPTQPPSVLSISTVNSDVESDAKWIPNLELEEWGEWEVGTERFHVNLMRLAVDNNDDPRDEDWIPEALKRKEMKRKKGELKWRLLEALQLTFPHSMSLIVQKRP